jgi:copper oxidase (laccase) domain-containing protein
VTRGEESACTGHLGSERSTSSGSRESRRQSLPPRLGKCHAARQCHSGQVEDVDEGAGARNEWNAAISRVRVGKKK